MEWKTLEWVLPLLISAFLVSGGRSEVLEPTDTTTTTTTSSASTTTTKAPAIVAETTTKNPMEDRIKCYACGLSEISPTVDGEDYCDLEKLQPNQKCKAGSKMYNHTCDIMDNLGVSDDWLRTCPEGVKSCFYSEGFYDEQNPIFRGCAGAKYPHDVKCDRELQAVQVVAGKKSVDVEVLLCYCNEDNCNLEKGGAGLMVAGLMPTLVMAIGALIMK